MLAKCILVMLFSSHLYAKQGLLPGFLLEDERNRISIFQRVAPAVVNISNLKFAHSGFFTYDLTAVPQGSGSGIVWDKKGHIVTNFHVIQKADKVMVTFADGKSQVAKIVGLEPLKDIAVLKLSSPKKGLRTVHLGNSSSLLVGQQAIAIGSPFGLDQTLTVGIISGLGRSIPGIGGVTIRDMIQTDASINPGNSGGPLLDSKGYLIGMNTMIYSQSGSSAGVGFAVPVNTINRIVNQLIRFGRVRRPGLGVSLFSERINQQLGIQGIMIRSVLPGGGAEKAGLKGTRRHPQNGKTIWGDVILAIDEKRVGSFDELYNTLETKAIGSYVLVRVQRRYKTFKVNVQLMELSD